MLDQISEESIEFQEEWLKVGTTFPTSLLAKVQEKVPEKCQQQADYGNKKQKKKKKEYSKSKQIEVSISQSQIDEKYDQILEQKYKINPDLGFQYKLSLGDNLLSVQILPFGDNNIYQYGIPAYDVPAYRRLQQQLFQNCSRLSDENTQQLLQELGLPLAQKMMFKSQFEGIPRYTQGISPQTSFQINSEQPFNSKETVVLFSKRLSQQQNQDFSKIKEQTILKKAMELQQLIQSDVHNLKSWKDFLEIQSQQAEIQGYNEPIMLANRRLAIVEKLEQSSEILADHPWVLAYKIFLMQNLELKDDEYHKQIDNLWDELFKKYVHIKPIWVLFLDHKLKTDNFSSTSLRLAANEHIRNLKNLIKESKRPQMINFFKSIYIELIQQIAFYEYEMGYRERALAIYLGLSELNIFAPTKLQRTSEYEKKINEFQIYWENYDNFKTGETMSYMGWRDFEDYGVNKSKGLEEYISQYKLNFIEDSKCTSSNQRNKEEQHSLLEQRAAKLYIEEQKLHKRRWKPSNSELDNETVQKNLDSLILYEDIEVN